MERLYKCENKEEWLYITGVLTENGYKLCDGLMADGFNEWPILCNITPYNGEYVDVYGLSMDNPNKEHSTSVAEFLSNFNIENPFFIKQHKFL